MLGSTLEILKVKLGESVILNTTMQAAVWLLLVSQDFSCLSKTYKCPIPPPHANRCDFVSFRTDVYSATYKYVW